MVMVKAHGGRKLKTEMRGEGIGGRWVGWRLEMQRGRKEEWKYLICYISLLSVQRRKFRGEF